MVSISAWPHSGQVMMETRIGDASAILLPSARLAFDVMACKGNRSHCLFGILSTGDVDRSVFPTDINAYRRRVARHNSHHPLDAVAAGHDPERETQGISGASPAMRSAAATHTV